MFAVLQTGGKQYKVEKDQILFVEKLDTTPGDIIQFNQILLVSSNKIQIGNPLVDGAAVKAEVVNQIKDKKVISFVKRRRKHSSQRTKGHRQNKTIIKITEILENSPEKVNFEKKLDVNTFLLKEKSKNKRKENLEKKKIVDKNDAKLKAKPENNKDSKTFKKSVEKKVINTTKDKPKTPKKTTEKKVVKTSKNKTNNIKTET